MCAALMTFIMGALSSLSPNFHTLLFFRGMTGTFSFVDFFIKFFLGIGIGGVPQS